VYQEMQHVKETLSRIWNIWRVHRKKKRMN